MFRMTGTDSAIVYFPTAGPDDIFCVVTHVNNFNMDEAYLRKWWAFIQNENNITANGCFR